MVLLLLIHANSFFSKRMVALYALASVLILIIVLLALFFLFPDNAFVHRLSNVFEGRDTSFRGRTFDAFYLGWKIADMKSIIWGSGLGQTKLLGLELWQTYYRAIFTQNSIAIPNAVGETLAVFGLVGVCIRFGLQVYFFFKAKVFQNHYRLLLFLFVLIYQFTGSFMFNIAEYVIWILAFSNIFPDFNKTKEPVKSLA